MNDVFPHYRSKTLEQFEASTPILKAAVNTVEGYIGRIALARAIGKGITFMGQNGTGKTHLACCVLTAARDTEHKIECIELATYIDLYLEMFRVQDADRIEYINDQLRYIKRCHFLLLDDLGREHRSGSGWSGERVFDLMRYRYNRGTPTLITTNLTLDELDERYGEGMSSHLQGSSIVVLVDGEDYRVRNADASWSDRD